MRLRKSLWRSVFLENGTPLTTDHRDCICWSPRYPPNLKSSEIWFAPNLYFLVAKLFWNVTHNASAYKRKCRQDDCPARHWWRWRQYSMSPVRIKAVTLTTCPFPWVSLWHLMLLCLIVRRAGLMRSQQDFEWWWSVPLSSASLYESLHVLLFWFTCVYPSQFSILFWIMYLL